MKDVSNKLFKLIKEDSRFNPLDESFEIEVVYEKFEEENLQDSPLLDFLFYCNKIYNELLADIVKTLTEIKIAESQLLDELFKRCNFLFFEVTKRTLQHAGNEHTFDFEERNFSQVEINGQNVSTKFSIEIGPDITAEIIHWINRSGGLKPHFINEAHALDNSVLSTLVNKFWTYGNLILNLKDSAYDNVKFRQRTVAYDSDGNFRIKEGLESIDFLLTCGEIRSNNHLTEAEMRITKFINPSKNKKQIKAIFEGDFIHYKTQEGIETEKGFLNTATLLVYHFFLSDIKLKNFGGLTLYDLSTILFHLGTQISKMAFEKNAKQIKTPYKIDKKNLLEIVIYLSNRDEEIAKRIIQSLCSSTEKPYFWRGAIYEGSDYYYIPLVSLSTPNYNLYLEKWIALENVTFQQREELFTGSIIKEIEQNGHQYQFDIVPFADIKLKEEFFKNNILIETNDHYLVLQITLYSFAIEFSEVDISMKIFARSIEELINKKSLVEVHLNKHKNEKNIILLVVTNYPQFSGLVLNNVPIIDYTLFKNYFNSGEYSRSIFTYDKGIPIIEKAGSLEYYKDEKEFNKNIKPFFDQPIPVLKIIDKLGFEEIPITPPFLSKQIFIDKVTILDEEIIVEDQIRYFSDLLTSKYFTPTLGDQGRIDDIINLQLHLIFNKLAYSSIELSKYRNNIYNAVSNVNETGFFFLSLYIIKALPALKISIKPREKLHIDDYPEEEIETILSKAMPFLKGEQRISSFKLDSSLSKNDKSKILSYAYGFVVSMPLKPLSDDEFDSYLFMILFLCGLRHDFEIEEFLFTALSNLIDHLNFNNRYQDARDICEEILVLYSNDHKHWYAWCIMFKCYSNQNNHFDAALYGCLLFTTLPSLVEIPYHLIVSSLHYALIFFRTFGYIEFAKNIYDSSKSLALNEYDNQKMAISYFNTVIANQQLLSEEFIDEVSEYLHKKIEVIISFQSHGIMPWLSLVYNLIRLKTFYQFEINKDIFKFQRVFEENIDRAQVDYLQTIILGKSENLKATFINAISRIVQSRSIDDFMAEVNNVLVIAQNLLRHSLDTNDINGILLSSYALNDQSFTFKNKPLKEGSFRVFNFYQPEEINKDWEKYGEFVLNNVPFKQGQILLWIFDLYHRVYCFTLSRDKSWQVVELQNWNRNQSNDWIDNLEKFSFNSKKSSHYDKAEQEEDYKSVLTELTFSEIPFTSPFSEVLLLTSIDIAKFPYNLYQYKHDFIGSQFPTCNILSFERYIENSSPLYIRKSFTSSAWIPIEDAELTISWGYEKLLPVLKKLSSTIYTSRYPSQLIETDINVFLAHGETGDFGFKVINTNKAVGGSLVYPKQVFGNGIIAVLFICNTGKANENFFLNNIISFATDLLKTNYQAVIAPFWKLDVTMTCFWLQEFISVFKEGYTINESVYLANKEIANYQESISNCFYAVEGQLAMHLYGNPNIKISES